MENSNSDVIAWLIEKCPNFYFMPSLSYDQIFLAYGSKDIKMSCSYWVEERGYSAIPLVPCNENEATHWIATTYQGHKKGIFDEESRDAVLELGGKAIPVKRKL